MPTFGYRALDDRGRPQTGSLETVDRLAAIAALSSRGLFPVELSDAAAGPRLQASSRPRRARRLSGRDITELTDRLASLLSTGFPVTRALAALAQQAENPALETLLEDLKRRLEEGDTLAGALSAHPKLFGELYQAMVRAGEAGGFLGEALERLAEMREREEELLSKVRAALTYPAIMAAVMLLAVAVIFTFVIPAFGRMFEGTEAALPGPTRFLMSVSELAASYWYLGLLLPVAAIAASRRWLATAAGRRHRDIILLTLPKLGGLTRKLAAARFSRMLSTLLHSGVPLLDALGMVRDVAGNVIISDAITRVAGGLSKGERIAGPLSESGVFPPMVIQMIALGEESGQLEKTLARVAQRYDREVRAELDGLIGLIEPLMTVVMGLVVGGVVLAMILPIFQLGGMTA